MRASTGRGLALACLAAAGTLTGGPALAWGTLLWADSPPQLDALSAGLSAWAYPRSPQGQHTERRWSPAIDYRRADGWFVSTESGLGRDLSTDPDWQVGARLWPQLGRDHRDATPTLPAVGPRLQEQLFANHLLGGLFMLQSALSWGGGQRRDGLQLEAGLASGLPVAGGSVGLGLSVTWANGADRRAYAGVPVAGWSDVCWTLGFDHRFNALWHVDAQVQQARVWSPAAQGPVRMGMLALWRDW